MFKILYRDLYCQYPTWLNFFFEIFVYWMLPLEALLFEIYIGYNVGHLLIIRPNVAHY